MPPAPAPAARPAAPAPAPARRPSAPAPTPASPARGSAPQAAGGDVAPGMLELKGLSEFKPPAPMADFLDARKTSTVNARFGSLAQGPIEVRTVSKGKYQFRRKPLPLTHPAFARVAEYVPALLPALIVSVIDGKLTGEIGLAAGEKVESIAGQLKKTPEMLGLMGFTIPTLPTPINKLEGGSLHLGLTGVPIKLGSAFSGTFSFDVIDSTVTFEGSAAVNVKGLAQGTLDLKRAADGAITGKATVGLNLPKNISGSVDVAWDGVAITGTGKVGYTGEKFSGTVTLYLMEKKQAEQLAESKKAPEGAAPKPEAAAPGKKPAKIDYVVFGEGDLTFSFTDWLNGTAHVIIDPVGHLTVIGKITPQKEFILFEQKDYVKQLFKLEARASYGLPVVGNVFIFANVSMDLFAKLGPAKFYNIVIEGTYSTDPKVAQNFSIRGSLNISAAAGARLRGEAGLGLEILAHDIKAGAGINGIAGVKAYAEATPIIGYREKAAEGQDKKGEWFIRGELEVAAQPFLGLSGDLFVEVDAPWWSPVPDKKWTWPLFGKEWPLGGTMGMLVSVDYVFGSGQWPKFDFKPVEFDSAKFMTNMYEDKAKSGSGKEAEQKGKWAEKNSKAAEPPAKASPKGNAAPGKAAALPAPKSKPVSSKKSGKPADPNAKTKEGKSVKQLQDEAAKKGKKPDGKDAKGGKGETKGKPSDPEAVKSKALDEVRTKAQGGKVQTLEDFHTILGEVVNKYRAEGLKSLVGHVDDPGTLNFNVSAVASPGSKISLKWKDVFHGRQTKAARDLLKKIKPEFEKGGFETYAAVSVDGKLIGARTNEARHAERELLKDESWGRALEIAKTNAEKNGSSTVVLIINRSPCQAICTTALAHWIGDNKGHYAKVNFILAPTGTYKPIYTRESMLKQAENLLTETGRELAVPLDKLPNEALRQLLEPLVPTEGVRDEEATTQADITRLEGAGWDVRQLNARGGKESARGKDLATKIAAAKKTVAREFDAKEKAGK